MKTAISLSDALFKAGEKARKKLKVSRSRLYAEALRRYLEALVDETLADGVGEEAAAYGTRDRDEDERVVTGVLKRSEEYRLERAIAEFYNHNAPPVDPAGMAAQLDVLDKEDW